NRASLLAGAQRPFPIRRFPELRATRCTRAHQIPRAVASLPDERLCRPDGTPGVAVEFPTRRQRLAHGSLALQTNKPGHPPDHRRRTLCDDKKAGRSGWTHVRRRAPDSGALRRALAAKSLSGLDHTLRRSANDAARRALRSSRHLLLS